MDGRPTKLSTEAGARSVARLGGFACLVVALLGVLTLMFFAATGFSRIPVVVLVIVGIASSVFAVAAVRMRAGKGLVWGTGAALLLAFMIVNETIAASEAIGAGNFPSSTIAIAFVIHTLLLGVLIYGLRAVLLLRSGRFAAGDPADVFS